MKVSYLHHRREFRPRAARRMSRNCGHSDDPGSARVGIAFQTSAFIVETSRLRQFAFRQHVKSHHNGWSELGRSGTSLMRACASFAAACRQPYDRLHGRRPAHHPRPPTAAVSVQSEIRAGGDGGLRRIGGGGAVRLAALLPAVDGRTRHWQRGHQSGVLGLAASESRRARRRGDLRCACRRSRLRIGMHASGNPDVSWLRGAATAAHSRLHSRGVVVAGWDCRVRRRQLRSHSTSATRTPGNALVRTADGRTPVIRRVESERTDMMPSWITQGPLSVCETRSDHRVFPTPSKIPYGGFSPVRLQTGIRP